MGGVNVDATYKSYLHGWTQNKRAGQVGKQSPPASGLPIDERAVAVARASRKRAGTLLGRRGTILTGMSGLSSAPQTAVKTLLGA